MDKVGTLGTQGHSFDFASSATNKSYHQTSSSLVGTKKCLSSDTTRTPLQTATALPLRLYLQKDQPTQPMAPDSQNKPCTTPIKHPAGISQISNPFALSELPPPVIQEESLIMLMVLG